MRDWLIRTRVKVANFQLLLLAIGCSVALLYAGGSLAPVADTLGDLRFAWQRAPSGKIAVVEIDARSLDQIGKWPWPRSVHARLINQLVGAEPALVAMDVDFSAHSTPSEDASLEAALRDAGGSVLLAAFNQAAGSSVPDAKPVANLPIDRFGAQSWPASVNVVADGQGVVRRVAGGDLIGEEIVPSMAALMAGLTGRLPDFVRIDFSIDQAGVPRYSAIDVIEGRVPSSALTGQTLIVGATALELRDFFRVPAEGVIPGPLVQALAAETLIQDRNLSSLPGYLVLSGLLALTGIVSLLSRRLNWYLLVIASLGTAISIEAGLTLLQFWQPVTVDSSPWFVALLAFSFAAAGRETVDRKRRWTHSERRLRSTRAVLDQIVRDNFAGVLVVDSRGVVRAMSLEAMNLLQCSDLTGFPLAQHDLGSINGLVEHALGRANAGDVFSVGPAEICQTAEGGSQRLEYTITISRITGTGDRLDDLAVCLTFRDVTSEREAQERLRFLAMHDELTGLENRRTFVDRVDAMRSVSPNVAVLFFDLDRFKTINDTVGHVLGDALLLAVADRTRDFVAGHGGAVSRFGGDEFAVALCRHRKADVLDLARGLIACLSTPYSIGQQRVSVGVSIGCAFNEVATPASELLKRADAALYRAKQMGGGRAIAYDDAMDAGLRARQAVEIDLQGALDGNEFHLLYQPQVDLLSGRMVGVEALLRWRHPRRGLVSPAEFIPIAEAIGLIEPIGRWVLHEACREAASWPGDIKVSINVSPMQFTRGHLEEDVTSALRTSGLAAKRLDLEVTETLFVSDADNIRSTMNRLCDRSISFSIDDFGTGYSSLSYIRDFPVSKIKIDRSFVTGLPHDQGSLGIVRAVTGMAYELGLRVNAEGVETEEQATALRLLGCEEVQGWLYGKPQTGVEISRQLIAELSLEPPECDSKSLAH